MKYLALVIGLCVLAAAAAAGSQVWQWRERKLKENERITEQKAAETDAAVRLGLKTGSLPPHPFDRRGALDNALRLRPDRRFLLAAQELAGADVATRFSEGQWIVSVGSRDVARVAELPDFPELLKALPPLAKVWGAGAGDRHLLLRWLMQDANEQAVHGWIAASRDDEHVSIPAVGQLLLDGDLQVVATASETLPDLGVAELEGVRTTAPTDTDLLIALAGAQRSALQNLASHEDVRARLAADLRQAADTGNEGPLWRGADTAAWYAAAVAAALWSSAQSGYVLRDDASSLADVLGTWPLPVAAYPHRWLKARIAVDRGNTDDAYEALATARLPGPSAAADLLDAMATQFEPPDPRMIEAARVARRHFDSRPTSRLIWAEVLRRHHRDLDRGARLAASVVHQAPGAYPADEVALAKQLGHLDRLERLALDERLPFPARLEATKALADRRSKVPAERALRQLARERPSDPDTQERLIRFLHGTGRPKDALATAQDLVRRYGDDDSFSAATP